MRMQKGAEISCRRSTFRCQLSAVGFARITRQELYPVRLADAGLKGVFVKIETPVACFHNDATFGQNASDADSMPSRRES